ncbi:MAG: efflux RND transporter periplasmic adaptor subunit [Lachnospiraceae bacterium]|nr:efflux RND transporter periplasmic adaptor subunit [Lachnospiraceae bacterium]
MRPKYYLAASFAAGFVLILGGCQTTDIHELEEIPKELTKTTLSETVEVQKGDVQPEIQMSLVQNAMVYHNYSVDAEKLEFSELNVSVGDYVKAGQVLVVFKSEAISKELEKAQDDLASDRLLIEHTKRIKDIMVDPDKPDDENNKALAESYDRQIAMIQDDIKLKEILVQEKQRALDKCIIRAKEDGTITFINTALKNGIVVAGTDLITEASGDIGFWAEVTEDYDFEVGQVFKATSPSMEMDVEVTDVKVNESGSRTVSLKPASEDVVSVGNDRFEVLILKDPIKDVVYVNSETVFYSAGRDKSYVYIMDENGFRIPKYVEVGEIVGDMIIIKSGLEGGEEVCVNG